LVSTTAVPSRYVTVIVSLGDPIEIVRMPKSSQSPATFDALVGGLHASPVEVRGGGAAIRLELSPFGARSLLGVPAGKLASTVVDLDALWGARVLELRERLAAATSWDTRFRVIEGALVARLEDGAAPAPELWRTWELLVRSGGNIAVQDLAAEVGWSRRHLSERFRAEIGLAPKAAARVLRFERASWMLDSLRRPLAEVATRCGFADQAHLNREWQQLAGSTPREWLAQELRDPRDDAEFPFVQDNRLGHPAASVA
jgi:AraC-like DNA-binding protein